MRLFKFIVLIKVPDDASYKTVATFIKEAIQGWKGMYSKTNVISRIPDNAASVRIKRPQKVVSNESTDD
jgi:hypothetical protein